jgi:hypothetical protein
MKIQPYDLTFIAEGLGKREPPAWKWLAILVRHPDPVVREGAVYGIANALATLAASDSSPEVRTAAYEVIT